MKNLLLKYSGHFTVPKA